jgi:hypothetical protein
LSYVRSSSPIPHKPTINASTSTDHSSSTSSKEADEALVVLKSLGGTTARLRSQLNHALSVAYCQRLLARSRSTPTSIGIS